MPLTKAVIARVEDKAKEQKMTNLEIRSKTDTFWLAEVYQPGGHGQTNDQDDHDQEDHDDDTTDSDTIHESDSAEATEQEDFDEHEATEYNHDQEDQTLDEHADTVDDPDTESDRESDNEVSIDMEHPQDQVGRSDEDQEDQQDPELEDEESEEPRLRRSQRIKMMQATNHLVTQEKTKIVEYDPSIARVIVMTMSKINNGILKSGRQRWRNMKTTRQNTVKSFVETYTLKRGLKKFGQKARDAALKEVGQLHGRTCFVPIDIEALTESERRKAMESFLFLVEKKDGRVKARKVANGSIQRMWIDKEDAASPTVATESILITAVIEALEERDIASADIPNAFIQTKVENDKNGDRVVMKVRGELVGILIELDTQLYSPYVTYEKGQPVIYLHVLKAIYGMLTSAMLFYQKLRKDLENYGFEINPYDPCVANKIINGKQMTVTWHVDDMKISHKDPKVVDGFIDWLEKMYGDDELGHVTVTRGKHHEYLAMKLDSSKKGEVKIDMTKYVQEMLDTFPETVSKGASTPANENLYKINERSPKLNKKRAEEFHTAVAKALFMSKRARPDIQPTNAFLCTRVKNPTEEDWGKLTRMMRFLYKTKDDSLVLSADGTNIIKWYADAAFAVHADMKSQTGYTMTMGKGAIISASKKQKLNTRSSTEAELIAADEAVTHMLWTQLFLEAQGYEQKPSILYQDNKSAIQLENNGRASSHKGTRHINIRYFFMTDQINKNKVAVKYCPTDNMTADYMTKPTQGAKFNMFRRDIMNKTS